jgi:hypothetical protein
VSLTSVKPFGDAGSKRGSSMSAFVDTATAL